ncbi:MAG: copper homeostasis protein CutC [Streptococcus sp.]
MCKDPYASIEILINLGIDRLLTSGLRAKAADGKDLIKNYNKVWR